MLFGFLFASAAFAQPASQRFDVLIRGGRVMDGRGNTWFLADVGIRGDRIAAIGRLEGATAARVIDARGQLVVPGFIDIHSHADDNTGGACSRRPHFCRSVPV